MQRDRTFGQLRTRRADLTIRATEGSGRTARRAKGAEVKAIGNRVLVIDDDQSMREAIVSLLDAAGYASAAFDSAEAMLAAGMPDDVRCIVSDIRLPAMSGLDLLGALHSRGDSAPVILVTAHDTPALRDQAGRHGAVAYLSKPFGAAELLGAIALAAGPQPRRRT